MERSWRRGSRCQSWLAEGWSERMCRVAAPLPATPGSAACRQRPWVHLLRGQGAPCPTAAFAPSNSASSQASGSVQFVLVQRCPWKCPRRRPFAQTRGQQARSSTPGLPLASVLLRACQSLGSRPPQRPALSRQLVLPIATLGDGRGAPPVPGGTAASATLRILQRPLMDPGHLPGGAGAPLRDAAATRFAVEVSFPKSEVAKAKRW